MAFAVSCTGEAASGTGPLSDLAFARVAGASSLQQIP